MPDIDLPDNISATCDIKEAASRREFIILAVPSLFLLQTVKQILLVPSIQEGETTIAVVTKGFLSTQEGETAIAVVTKGFLSTPKGPRLILETLEDYLPGFYRQSLVYIAGPSHAEEVSRGKNTG